MRELQWQCYNKHQLSVYEKDGVLIYRYGVENQQKPDETPLVYFASDVPAAGFDCDRDAFIGSYRSEEAPIGLEHEHLKNSTLFGGDPCFALELPLTPPRRRDKIAQYLSRHGDDGERDFQVPCRLQSP